MAPATSFSASSLIIKFDNRLWTASKPRPTALAKPMSARTPQPSSRLLRSSAATSSAAVTLPQHRWVRAPITSWTTDQSHDKMSRTATAAFDLRLNSVVVRRRRSEPTAETDVRCPAPILQSIRYQRRASSRALVVLPSSPERPSGTGEHLTGP